MGKLFNRAKMSVSGTPGTGTITLGSAVSGYQTFAAAGVANADVVSYVIEDGSNWEYGQGTYTTTGTTLARTTVQASSNSGAAISATSSATVYIAALQADFVNLSSQIYPIVNIATALTALANNTRTSALQLASAVNVFTNASTTQNSALLPVPPASGSISVVVTNNAANPVNVFAKASSDTINGATAATSVAAGVTKTFYSTSATAWVA